MSEEKVEIIFKAIKLKPERAIRNKEREDEKMTNKKLCGGFAVETLKKSFCG